MEQKFLSRMKDLQNRCEKQSIVTHTGFLTPSEQQQLIELQKREAIGNLYFFGGHSGAERKVAFFLPFYMEEADLNVEEYISAFLAEARFSSLTHRDYLGALLGLGITRDCIGDIYVTGERANFFALSKVKDFIALNFQKAGSNSVLVQQVLIDHVNLPSKTVKLSNFTVKSPRIDSLASGVFHVSRAKISQMLQSGLVMLNYQQCFSKDTEIKEGDIISIRGYGKAKVTSFGGMSKKERMFVTAEIYQ